MAALRRRLAVDGVRGRGVDAILERSASARWHALAAADAAARMTGALVRSRGISRGAEARNVFERLHGRAVEQCDGGTTVIPRHYWSASPEGPDADGREQVSFRGAVLIAVHGVKTDSPHTASAAPATAGRTLSPELEATLEEPAVRPLRTIVGLVRAEGAMLTFVLVVALALAAAGVIVEALLFRGLFDIGSHLALSGQRATAIAALAALVAALLVIELPIAAAAFRLGRRLESRLRIRFLQKVARLGDRYLQSRPASDMAERCHSIHQIRLLPDLGVQAGRVLFALLLTAVAIAWIDPPSAVLAAASAAASLVLPLVAQPILRERDLRVRTHAGALGQFYLDSLLGLVAVRTHGAEPAVRREHEGLLVEWARAGFGLQRAAVAVEAAQLVVGFGLAAWLLLDRLGRGGDPGGALLLAYWALNLPVLGQELAHATWQYPEHRNRLLRLLEPLGAPEEPPDPPAAREHEQVVAPPLASGAALAFDQVGVRVAGHTVLHDLCVSIAAGAHVAVVGSSGAGKSSLVGLLLGWHRAATGRVLVDGVPLDTQRLAELRRHTAWVDPSVQLWNRSLLENLQYGTDADRLDAIGMAIDAAELRQILERLPDGLQTPLGEGGGLVSGGEGQRVRVARAFLRRRPRLVILDEPFRGLERDRRQRLLERARHAWRDATLLCVTHDVGAALTFDRVLVMAEGRIVEDGSPAALAARPDTHFHAMLDAETMVREGLWQNAAWRTLTLQRGRVQTARTEGVT
jgi:ATP-binding cassette subfamily B protein